MHIATKSSKINISSKKKLEVFAKEISFKVVKGKIFFLYGEMGVGKTTFVKYLINNLQLKFNNKLTDVTSPTFNIMNEYNVGDFLVKHYDLYRLKSSDELTDLNLFDSTDNSIVLIEWPEIIESEPKLVTKFFFEYKNDYQDRFIKILG
ncbi:tRNA (adenosine(37)-N6)-threonylcarbamoyltransferase complex ATPase subunit type 1 TsaE [Candidatus Pelagibacter communis]|uniref:tRNA (adenosine(37)-N6)-threonylcarbamoyltransferase complex ATPase subunit type 1 TsaE n=1 Tax=Pelagibacter ubique TaxID=198252 RepID=UPI0009E59748|nr:tRNA (adenosine(37)-N6)-threonylcarbamoyltransferase complex ATPase subunit type 1 TsaE [Candidatus Pelagibacter ubique]|tara:strand:+ start:440 stop:886 length:447 start_codon:yes stop_codon:yes gene_type:complete